MRPLPCLEGKRSWQLPGHRLFPGINNRPGGVSRAVSPCGDVDSLGCRCAGICIGLPVATADRVEIKGADLGSRAALSNAVTVAAILGAIADRIAVPVGFATFFSEVFAFANIVNGGALGGRDAGVRIGEAIAAADRAELPGAGLGAVNAFPDPIASTLFLGAIAAPPAVLVTFAALAFDRPIGAFADIVYADANRGSHAGVRIGLSVTAADRVE